MTKDEFIEYIKLVCRQYLEGEITGTEALNAIVAVSGQELEQG